VAWLKNAEFLDSSYKIPGGGYLSRTRNGAIEVAILTDRLIKRATRDIMWTPQMPLHGWTGGLRGLGGKPEQRKAWGMWATGVAAKEPAR